MKMKQPSTVENYGPAVADTARAQRQLHKIVVKAARAGRDIEWHHACHIRDELGAVADDIFKVGIKTPSQQPWHVGRERGGSSRSCGTLLAELYRRLERCVGAES